jgi:hypothetical protein
MADTKVAKYYRCSGGLTVGMTVCQEGEVLTGEAFGSDFKPMSPSEQIAKFNKVLYRPYTPDGDEDMVAIQDESQRVLRTSMVGMQHPENPPVNTAQPVAENIDMLDRYELRTRLRAMGINFGDDVDLERLRSTYQKRMKKAAEEQDEEDDEATSDRKERAKAAIERNNAMAAGDTSAASGSSKRSRRRKPVEEVEEEEETTETSEDETSDDDEDTTEVEEEEDE